MVDVRRNNCPPPRNFVANKLGRDVFRDARAEGLATVLKANIRAIVALRFVCLFPSKILANRDELHLGRNDSSARVSQLCHSRVTRGPLWSPLEPGK